MTSTRNLRIGLAMCSLLLALVSTATGATLYVNTDGSGGGAYHVVQCVTGEGPGTILEGFTIAGGNAAGAYRNDRGGRMYNNNSNPTVTNCFEEVLP